MDTPTDSPGEAAEISSPNPASPPAAKAVSRSKAKPEDAGELVRVKQKLEDEKRARKAREVRISELEDENFRLKKTQPSPAPEAKQKRSFLDGVTFFED